ncbi:MAG: SulP family inorganic anion transporter [Cyanobacteria bacterium SZAS TMP-1]|nr:SulP family inorganic anion transporter [Cyanobacteria bacterium SZAS TMP-1]
MTKEKSPVNGGKFVWSNLRADLLSSVVVFLVALPLCMGIAIASGLPPAKGIITGIVGGIIVGALSGSPLLVSGPAAGLAVVIIELIREHGIEKLGIIILLAGILQILFGMCRLATWFRAVPPAVIHGMLSGIGVLIFAAQFHVMVDDSPKGSGLNNLLSIPMAVIKGLDWQSGASAQTTHHLAAMLGMLTIVLLTLWQRFARGKVKVLPGSLIAIVVATFCAYAFHLPVRYVSIPPDLFASLELVRFGPGAPDGLSSMMTWNIFFDALAVAFIAAAETLLTCSAIDKMPKHSTVNTNYDRELIAQGVGNSICGLFGALPMTGVMVRSGVNVAAGARSRASTILHGTWILMLVFFFPRFLEFIPTSALAALLVFTGYKLVDVKAVKQMVKYGRSEIAIYLLTVILIVSVDLLTGVLAGIALSIAKLLYIFGHLDVKVAPGAGKRTDIWLNGAATFLALPKLAGAIESVPVDCELHIHLDGLAYVDHAVLDLLISWDRQHRQHGGMLVIDWGKLGEAFRERRMAARPDESREFRPAR